MEQARPHDPDHRAFRNAGFAAAIVLTVLAYALSVCLKGPILDEFWTAFYADPAVDLSTAWARWSSDMGHPVGYNLYLRTLFDLFPQSIESGRLLNFLPLALFVSAILVARRTPGMGVFSYYFSLTVLGGFIALERFATQRAYFSCVIIIAILTVVGARMVLDRRANGGLLVVVLVSSLIGAGFDYMTFLTVNALMFAVGVYLYGFGRRPDAWRIALCLACGWAEIGLSLWNAMNYPAVAAPYRIGSLQFLFNYAVSIGLGLLGNVVILLIALRALKNGALENWRRDPRKTIDEWRLPIVLAGAIALTLVGYFLLNCISHSLVKRHLFGVAVLVGGLVSALAAREEVGRRMQQAAVVCMATTLAVGLVVLWKTPNFRLYGPILAGEQDNCADFRIFGINYTAVGHKLDTPNRQHADAALSAGYRTIAREYGFRLSDPAPPHVFSDRCGGAIWLEQVWFGQPPSPHELLTHLQFAVSPAQLARARLHWNGENALVLIVPGKQ